MLLLAFDSHDHNRPVARPRPVERFRSALSRKPNCPPSPREVTTTSSRTTSTLIGLCAFDLLLVSSHTFRRHTQPRGRILAFLISPLGLALLLHLHTARPAVQDAAIVPISQSRLRRLSSWRTLSPPPVSESPISPSLSSHRPSIFNDHTPTAHLPSLLLQHRVSTCITVVAAPWYLRYPELSSSYTTRRRSPSITSIIFQH